MSASDRIEYPNNIKPITDDLRDDELVKRLKVSFSGLKNANNLILFLFVVVARLCP